jgi:hypothetical protein
MPHDWKLVTQLHTATHEDLVMRLRTAPYMALVPRLRSAPHRATVCMPGLPQVLIRSDTELEVDALHSQSTRAGQYVAQFGHNAVHTAAQKSCEPCERSA